MVEGTGVPGRVEAASVVSAAAQLALLSAPPHSSPVVVCLGCRCKQATIGKLLKFILTFIPVENTPSTWVSRNTGHLLYAELK